jgi:hypothetical protein
VPVANVRRKDGSGHVFHFTHFLDQARSNPAMVYDLERVWLTGTLLAIGDALDEHDYFDRAPELELLRYLRNGVAHGNQFNIRSPDKLAKFPAHNKLASVKGNPKSVFEVTPDLHGKVVLFDFMGPGDVLDVLLSIGTYLIRMGNGDPLRA